MNPLPDTLIGWLVVTHRPRLIDTVSPLLTPGQVYSYYITHYERSLSTLSKLQRSSPKAAGPFQT